MTDTLRYAPPPQRNPTIITVPTGFYSGSFGVNEDVIFNFPASNHVSAFTVVGGRHMRVIGGSSVNGSSGSAIRFSGISGSVFLEGLFIDISALNVDAINACGNTGGPFTLFPDIYIQNCRILGVNGTNATTHADVFQAQGSIGTLYIDKVTASSNYQGISIFQNQFPTKAAYISRTNLFYTAVAGDTFTDLFWNMDNHTTPPFKPVFLDEFYIAPRAGQDLTTSIWPYGGGTVIDSLGNSISAFTTDSWATAHFPPGNNTYGKIISGAPAGGDFCPAGVAGLSYVSPGYDTPSSQNGFESVYVSDTAVSPIGRPEGCRTFIMSVETANTAIRWRADGVDPTATNGHYLSAGKDILLDFEINKLRMIRDTASADTNVSFTYRG